MACWLSSGSLSATVLRARCSRLLTAGTLVSSASATSRAEKPEHLAQEQHGALRRRQVLDGCDEGELNALALFVARVRRGKALVRRLARVGLDPDRLRERLAEAAVRVGGGQLLERQRALGAARDRVERRVGGDLVQPRAGRAAPVEARQPAPGAQERVLQRVVGVVHRAEHAVAVRVQFAAMGLDEAAERVLVALLGRVQQGSLAAGRFRGDPTHGSQDKAAAGGWIGGAGQERGSSQAPSS